MRGGLNIVHPEDRVEELNWSRQIAACLDNDDDAAEAQLFLIVKQIRKVPENQRKDMFWKKNLMKINDMH